MGKRPVRVSAPTVCSETAGMKRVLFANTHLDHISPEARENGIALILERLKPYLRRYPAILTGDFNSFPGDKPVLLAGEKLRDARLRAELGGRAVRYFPRLRIQIPHDVNIQSRLIILLVTPEIRVMSFRDYRGF